MPPSAPVRAMPSMFLFLAWGVDGRSVTNDVGGHDRCLNPRQLVLRAGVVLPLADCPMDEDDAGSVDLQADQELDEVKAALDGHACSQRMCEADRIAIVLTHPH